MVVNKINNPIEKIQAILEDQNGIISTSDLKRFGIPRNYLSILVKNGDIQRISRGVYSVVDCTIDEMASFQARFKRAIYSHETALYLLGLSDRTPLYYSVTVPSGYNAASVKQSGAKVYFIKQSLYFLGLITVKSSHGNDIKTFNLERTVCDIIRSRNHMDIQLVNEALKKYVVQNNRNINQLYDYAKQFRIKNIIRDYIEILL